MRPRVADHPQIVKITCLPSTFFPLSALTVPTVLNLHCQEKSNPAFQNLRATAQTTVLLLIIIINHIRLNDWRHHINPTYATPKDGNEPCSVLQSTFQNPLELNINSTPKGENTCQRHALIGCPALPRAYIRKTFALHPKPNKEWMTAWMNEWLNEWMNERTKERMNECMDGWMNDVFVWRLFKAWRNTS